MEKRTMKSRIVLAVTAMLVLFVSLTAFGGGQKEVLAASSKTNKAARLRVSFNGKESTTDKIWDQNSYGIQTDLKKKSKVKKGTTVSYKVVVPKDLLKKNGDTVLFCMDLCLADKYLGGGVYRGVGVMYKTSWCQITKEGKKTYLCVYNEVKDKHTKQVAAKKNKTQKVGNASIREQGKYYVITMKDKYLNTYYNYKKGKNVKLDTKKSYYLSPELVVHGDCSKLKGYIYLDEFTVNAAKKQTVTFNKKDYSGVGARHYSSDKWDAKWKIVNLLY